MEEKNIVSKVHKILLTNRKNGSFTGILDVLSFDINEILLETEQGMLHVKGKDLHVNRLNLEKGEKIQLVGFGTFEVSERAARTGRNPQTGEEMPIAASKAPKFKAGKALKDSIN